MTLDDLRKIAEAAASVRTYTEEYAEFIATFNPKRVLELLDRIEMLEREHGEMTEVIEPQNEHIRELTKATYVQHARLAAVEKLHEEVPSSDPVVDGLCDECYVPSPCPTIKAVRGE